MKQFKKNVPADYIDVDKYTLRRSALYVYLSAAGSGTQVRVLVRCDGKYYWSNLYLVSENTIGSDIGFKTGNSAIETAMAEGFKVYEFENQCEFRDWLKKNGAWE